MGTQFYQKQEKISQQIEISGPSLLGLKTGPEQCTTRAKRLIDYEKKHSHWFPKRLACIADELNPGIPGFCSSARQATKRSEFVSR